MFSFIRPQHGDSSNSHKSSDSVGTREYMKPKTSMYYLFQVQKQLPKVFLLKRVLKICSKYTGEHTCRSVISIKLQSNLIKITLRHGCSPVNLLHIFRKPFSRNTSWWLLLQEAIKGSYFQELLQILLSKFFRWSVADGKSKDPGLSYVNTSELVSILLKDYNKNTLPVREKKPLEVSIQLFIEDMIPLEKRNMVRKTSDRLLLFCWICWSFPSWSFTSTFWQLKAL